MNKKILILCPTLNPHGGIRVIVEWANNLARRGHDVTLHVASGGMQEWIAIAQAVNVQLGGHWSANHYDTVIATTPPLALDLDARKTTAQKFFLLQMAEHLFSPGTGYERQSIQSYNVNMPIIGISKWVESLIKREHGRKGEMYYIGNGVSSEFKPGKKDSELTVMVADWEGYNAAKDVNAIGPKVANELKELYGAKIIAWSALPCKTLPDVPDEYYQRASTETLVKLYQRCHLVIRASMYDARSCSPVEAMACGTATARAIHQGDDDLIHGYNCLRSGYDYRALLYNAKRLITDQTLRERLEKNGLEYRKQWLSWGFWMDIVEDIIALHIPVNG